MTKMELRLADVQSLLAKACDAAGGQRAFAEKHDLNSQYVNHVLQGHRPPSASLCAALGIKSDGERWVRK